MLLTFFIHDNIYVYIHYQSASSYVIRIETSSSKVIVIVGAKQEPENRTTVYNLNRMN